MTNNNNHHVANPTPTPNVMVIFGATGDLTKRKLIPALCNLANDGMLSETIRHRRLRRQRHSPPKPFARRSPKKSPSTLQPTST